MGNPIRFIEPQMVVPHLDKVVLGQPVDGLLEAVDGKRVKAVDVPGDPQTFVAVNDTWEDPTYVIRATDDGQVDRIRIYPSITEVGPEGVFPYFEMVQLGQDGPVVSIEAAVKPGGVMDYTVTPSHPSSDLSELPPLEDWLDDERMSYAAATVVHREPGFLSWRGPSGFSDPGTGV
jgi:hypothetical protein